ncbi:protein NRT1/ PTR FAMILY 4.3-like [Macadamia integrifolia]|uniref:protein NRT1/ PTR FAMILY 4.3-like n=1 Tax=Macadamia integrifolia TaxID=60698 RepID=UPI001C4F9617|nr:protein NRT1/ PTR FAMILY 4.3-like [Macadamia integrifolia]
MAMQGFVDWKGEPIEHARHGGARAVLFIYIMAMITDMSCAPIYITMINYLHGTLDMDLASTSTTITNFIAATCGFALLGGFISDAYITRFQTLLHFCPLMFIGQALLALHATFLSLSPLDCGIPEKYKLVHGVNTSILHMGLYTLAFGEAFLRANLPPFGADQFDDTEIFSSRSKSSYFNWLSFICTGGSIIGLILVDWIQNHRGWVEAFVASATLMGLGLVVLTSGFRFYRNQIPSGSPLTRILQVFVAAFRKRKLPLPPIGGLHQNISSEEMMGEVLEHTMDFRFLDKAAISCGMTPSKWSLCTVTQVEEAKIVLRMLPIFISTVFAYIPMHLLVNFSLLQTNTMSSTRLGTFYDSPVSILAFLSALQMVFIVVYDQLLVPLAKMITGYQTGITRLQRVGVGFMVVPLAMCIAAMMERERKRIAEDYDLIDSKNAYLPMSTWLGLQYFAIVIFGVFTYIGLLEFFNSETSRGMKSMGSAMFNCMIGLSSLLSSVLVNVLKNACRDGDDGRNGWMEGNNLNKTYLDRFYWLLSLFSLVGFLNYLYWANKYVYKRNRLTLFQNG